MRQRWLMGLAIVGLNLTLLAAVVVPSWAGGRYQATVNEAERFEARNDVRRVELNVDCAATTMDLRVHVRLTRGMMTWRLLDPQGKVQAEGEAVPGQGIKEARSVRPTEGRWVLEIKWLGATGSHDVNWHVR